MKVCQIISGDLWAGAEVMYTRLLQGLQKFRGLELSSILLNDGKVAEEVRKAGIPVEIVDEAQLNFYQITRKIQKIVTGMSPDIIHSHRLKENILSSFARGKDKKKIPLICTQHGMDEPLQQRFNVKRKILSAVHHFILNKDVTYLVTVSKDMKSYYLQKHHFQEKRVKVIYNGTDIDHSTPIKTIERPFVIGSAGRLFPVKDYSYMVEIARRTWEKNINVRFELAGDGPEREKILSMIRKYELDSVFTVKGFVDNMVNFYQGLDLYINTSLHEGFPMSILEAMAHRLPVIAPNTGGINELLIDGIHGYLVEGRDPDVFAGKCLQLYEDVALRRKMGSAARDRVLRDFSSEKMAQEYYDLYQNVMKNHAYESFFKKPRAG